MKEYQKIDIAQGVELVCVPADRFKTNDFRIGFCLPLDKNTVARNALAIYMLSNSSEEYPDVLSVNKKLAHLYGAELNTTVNKVGDNQVMSIALSSLDDRFSLGGRISTECIELLLSLVFKPRLDENGKFFDDDLHRQQRIIIEKLESEQNEKRLLAVRRLEEIMFDGEPYALNRYGTEDMINSVTTDDIMTAWQEMLKNAKIQLVAVGNFDIDEITDKMRSAFSSVDRSYNPPVKSLAKPAGDAVKNVTDRMDVKQGKLVLGYRVNLDPCDPLTTAMRSFNDTFGGGPYSKLFANVREKMSLCYYCSARYDRRKSCIIIQCGCEEYNMDKAIAEIGNQLNEIIAGNFATELEASKVGLSDTINSVYDDSTALVMWYSSQIIDDEIKAPSQSAEENNSVLADDIQKCSTLASLDTVYKLCGIKEGE